MNARSFDRTDQDPGNIIELGHVNYRIADQRLATAYYVTGLGLTRDPVLMTGNDNMWINAGISQFHLPTGEAISAPRTKTGLVVPDLEHLLGSLQKASAELEDTKFSFRETNDGVETTCPWGNRITCHAPDPDRFGQARIGMAYVEFDTPSGTSEGIARFYREIFGAHARTGTDDRGPFAKVDVGESQELIFRETGEENIVRKTHHIQFYLCDFSGPHKKLLERYLISQESNAAQYRFEDIVDLDSGDVLFSIDHEVRSMRHPMYGRPLINRNAVQNARDYHSGHDQAAITLA